MSRVSSEKKIAITLHSLYVSFSTLLQPYECWPTCESRYRLLNWVTLCCWSSEGGSPQDLYSCQTTLQDFYSDFTVRETKVLRSCMSWPGTHSKSLS